MNRSEVREMRSFAQKKVGMAPISVLFFVGTVLTDRTGAGIATVLAAAFHELGHVLAAKRMQIPLRALRLDLLGARIEVKDRLLSYGEEWLLAAAGPLFSLLGAAVAAPLWGASYFWRAFSAASLILGLFNLLPVRTFDGGRMTEAFFSRTLGVEWAYRIMNVITFLFLCLLWILSVYFLLRAGGGLSLFCFSATLLSRFLESGKIG